MIIHETVGSDLYQVSCPSGYYSYYYSFLLTKSDGSIWGDRYPYTEGYHKLGSIRENTKVDEYTWYVVYHEGPLDLKSITLKPINNNTIQTTGNSYNWNIRLGQLDADADTSVYDDYTFILNNNNNKEIFTKSQINNYVNTLNEITYTFNSSREIPFGKALYLMVYCENNYNSITAGINSQMECNIEFEIADMPQVTQYSKITKAQMDALRTYKNYLSPLPTAASQGGIIYASTGNTYKNTITAGHKITANWYNGLYTRTNE